MKKYILLKLIGLVVLTMSILVIISIAEVAFYSYIINPGLEESAYELHANASAPYISGIFGFIIFFLVIRYWKKKNYHNTSQLAILFPFTYLVIDTIIITAAGVRWADFILIFIVANSAKVLGSFFGYILTSKNTGGGEL